MATVLTANRAGLRRLRRRRVEARYVGSRGHKLLEARAFNQGYDLNDPSTPDYIFERFNKAYVDAGAPNGPLKSNRVVEIGRSDFVGR